VIVWAGVSGVGIRDVLEVSGRDRGVELVGLHHCRQQLGGLKQRRQVPGDIGGTSVEASVQEGIQFIGGID
jgi:hypothetical protein